MTTSRMTEGRKVGGPKESGLTGGERASRGVRAAWAYHTGTCLGALATVPYGTAHVVERRWLLKPSYLKLICQSLKYIRGHR